MRINFFLYCLIVEDSYVTSQRTLSRQRRRASRTNLTCLNSHTKYSSLVETKGSSSHLLISGFDCN